MDKMPIGDSLAKWRHLGVTEKNLVYSSNEFVVFLDDEEDVDWESDTAYDQATLHKIIQNPLWGKIDGDRAALEAMETTHLRAAQKTGFRRQIGTGMCLALSGQLENAISTLAAARAYIGKCNKEVSRIWILASASAFVVLISVALLFLSMLPSVDSLSRQQLLAASFAGAIGSWVSISSRLTSLGVEPGDGFWLHFGETGRRIVLGAIAGPLILWGARLGFVLTIVANAGFGGAALIGLASGMLERLLPEMADKLAGSSSGK